MAQTTEADTSFTIQGTFIKEKKKFPFIQIASPVPSENIIRDKDIAFRQINNRTLYLDLTYVTKTTEGKRPAVLLVFGGGWRSGDRSHNQAIAIALANRGYLTISPDYRLSGEALFPAAIHDLKASVRWLKENADKYQIDTNRIAALGCSAGGQLVALMGATNNDSFYEDTIGYRRYSSAIHAVINIDGILAFHHPESKEGVSASKWLGGDYTQQPDRWKKASALEQASPGIVPMLFLNSSQPRFHAGRDDLIRKMKEWNIAAEVHTFPDTPHPFWFFHPWFDPMMNHILTFLDKQFKRTDS